MPRRLPTFRPRPAAPKRGVEARPSSHARGYCSRSWELTRRAVIARDMGQCQGCGKPIHEPGDAQVDHIVPKPLHEHAAATPLEGLQLLCRSCHSRKTVRDGS